MNHTRMLLGITIVIAAVGVASASAAGTKSSVDVPGAGFASATTDCPKGTALVSQGFGTKSFTTDGTGSTVVRVDSHRSGTGLESRAVNFGPDQGVFDAYAYCSQAGKDLKVVRDKVFMTGGTAGVAKASCPQGSVPVGGGFGSPGFAPMGPQVITLTSRRQGHAWRVEGVNQVGGSGRGGVIQGALVAYAYCMEDAPRVVIRKESVKVDRAEGLKTVVATCPKGREAVSGGFDGNLEFTGSSPRAGGVVVSRRAKKARAWKARAVPVSETTGKATVYAYCMKS